MLDRTVTVYIADNGSDDLHEVAKSTIDAVEKRNKELNEKFERSFFDAQKVSQADTHSFADLRTKYPFLANLDAAKKHYGFA